MAITLTRVKALPDQRRTIYTLTCDGSYSSGGYAISPRDLGLFQIDSLMAYETSGQGNLAQWDAPNGKLRVFQTGAALSGVFSEAVSGDLSTANVFRIEATGNPVL